MEPSPERNRKITWTEFLVRHWKLFVAADLFTTEVWSRKGCTKFVVLFLIDLPNRKVKLAGLARQANAIWMCQAVRNLSDVEDAFLRRTLYLLHGRDPLFTGESVETRGTIGVQSVRLPPLSPNLNVYAERFVRTTGLTNKTAAGRAEAIHKAELAEGRAGIACRGPCPTFESVLKNEFTPWSEKQHAAHPNTHVRYQTSAKPLISFSGKWGNLTSRKYPGPRSTKAHVPLR